MTSSQDDEFRVGRGRPPRHSRFAPGRSGNPRGRPKGRVNIARVLAQVLAERPRDKDGQPKQAAGEDWIRDLVTRAKGSLHASRLLRDLLKDTGLSRPEPIEDTPQQPTPDDQAVIDDFLRRLQREEKK